MKTTPHSSRKIVVDADACPVKAEIVKAARLHRTEVLMVASFAHVLQPAEGVTVVQVDRSDQSADIYIANHLREGDILVTQDFGLATIGLAKKAVVLSNRGQRYSDETIGFLLEARSARARERRAGRYGKGPRPMEDKDRHKFLQTLTKVLEARQENLRH